MKYSIERTSQFKRDFKLAEKQGLDMNELAKVITILANGETLPEKYRDHELQGNYKRHRECHIESDWLLVYRVERDELICTAVRTGTHSDLFGK